MLKDLRGVQDDLLDLVDVGPECVAETPLKLKQGPGLNCHDDIFERTINIHPVSLVELIELRLPYEEPMSECVSAEEIRAEGDLLEVAQCLDDGVRYKPPVSEPLVLEVT